MGRFQQRFDVPGKQFFESIGRARLGQLLEQVEQVCVGFQSSDLRAAPGTHEWLVLADSASSTPVTREVCVTGE